MERTNKGLVLLAWLWVGLVAAYLAWGAATYSGLYRWLAELQLAQSGAYYQGWTAMVPGFVLATPALLYIKRHSQIAEASAERGPQAVGVQERTQRAGCRPDGQQTGILRARRQRGLRWPGALEALSQPDVGLRLVAAVQRRGDDRVAADQRDVVGEQASVVRTGQRAAL